ncbi:MAG: tetratricopeptide repeat protein [Flaviaesturariibacter sp.]|nr:tetratricopeptide repeat protein [Flaviaesturariibacter sp.]
MRRIFLFAGVFLFSINVLSQYAAKEARLIRNVSTADTDSEKVGALGSLANFYYIYRAERKGDSILQKQFSVAEMSEDKELVLQALFGEATNNISNWTSSESFDRAIAFVEKGIAYAREKGSADLESQGYLRKAAILRKRRKHDEAFQQATQALTTLGNRKQDSLRAMVYLELGDIFLAKGDAVAAYKNFNNAYDLAYTNRNKRIQSLTYHYYSKLYNALGSKEMAIKSLHKSVTLNKEDGNKRGLLEDYYDLARITDEKEYFSKTIQLASELNSELHKLNAKRLQFAYLMVVRKNNREALDYLSANEDMRQSYLNVGNANYHITLGNIYRYTGQFDSALHYYKLAEPLIEQSFDKPILKSLYKELGASYAALGSTGQAIAYYEKALAISRSLKDLPEGAHFTERLSMLAAKASDYKSAFAYNQEHLKLKDTLHELAAQRDLVLLELDRENNRHQKDIERIEANALRTRNLQYMGISIAIVTVFTFMILLGMFPVSKLSIKMLGFFSFICLFEFIVLLIDSYLHKLTHGEPLKIWLVKIFLIALLVPIQHYMEHGMVKFLESQRLLKMRQQLSVKKLLLKWKKPALVEAGFEEDTAVL